MEKDNQKSATEDFSDLPEEVERKLLMLASNPSHPIWKNILPKISDIVAGIFRATADLAEIHAKATGCHCGHEIAKMIMDAAPKSAQSIER